MQKTILVLALVGLVAAFATAAGTQQESMEDDFVELKMTLVGDTVPDYDMMLEELNELMAEDINASLSVNFTTWVDWQTKMRLMLASGERFDLIHMAPWGIYTEQAQAGNLQDLSELGPEYAPETWASYSDAVLKQATVNDGIYMLPFRFTEPSGSGYIFRRDLVEEYGIADVTSPETLIAYLTAVQANESFIPYNAGEFDLAVWPTFMDLPDGRRDRAWKELMGDDDGVVAYVFYDDPETILYDYETDLFLDTAEYLRGAYLAGLIPRNVLANTVGSREAFLAGQSALTSLNPLNANEEYQRLKDSQPDWELGYYVPHLIFESIEAPTAINNGMSIPLASENPERAMMLLELLHQDRQYHDLTSYGIRGVHWDLDENGEIVAPEGLVLSESGFPWDRPAPWGWREEKFYRLDVRTSSKTWPEVRESQNQLAEILVDARWTDFTFDKTPVSTEISALNTVRSGTFQAIGWGVVDPAAEYDNLVQEYENAGIETVKAELERQWTEYLAEQAADE